MLKFKISFRYKIQFAVLLLLTLTLGGYIGLASETLLKEKIASLLETTSANAEVTASRISRKLLAQEYWLESTLALDPKVRETQLQHNKVLLNVVRRNGDKVETLFAGSKEANQQPPFSAPKGLSFLPNTDRRSFWIVKVFENEESLSSLWSEDFFAEEQRNAAEAAIFLNSALNSEMLTLSQEGGASRPLAEEIKRAKLPKTLVSKRLEVNGEKYVFASAPVDNFAASVGVAFPESMALEPVRDLQRRSVYFAILVIGLTGLVSFWIGRALTQKLVVLTRETDKIAKGDLDSARPISTNDEIGDLSRSIVSMAKDLKRYIEEVSEKSRMEAELKTAKTVQDMLFPESNWNNGKFEVQGFYESASECGGDLWFYWNIDQYLFFIVADATGHGAPAALITSAARSALANVEYNKEVKVERIAELLHHAVKVSSKGTILMTAFLGRVDLELGNVQYVNCSHEHPFVIHEDGKFQNLSDVNNARIGDTGAAQEPFEVGEFKLEKGMRICVYTDGLSDMENASGRRYSDRKFSQLIVDSLAHNNPISAGVDSIVSTLKDYSEHRPLADDLTMVVIGQLS